MRLTSPQLGFVTIISLGAPVLAQCTYAESVFADALDYTVRIKTSIEIPFFEDNQGTVEGAGFIVDSDRRWIVTNAHVVGHSPSRVKVALHDGKFQLAHKVYVDSYLDLAILELPPVDDQRLVVAPLECMEGPGTGHPVGAFGHPFGLEYTGTQGVISGKTSEYGGELLQTDAPINGGNSGGPLISLSSGAVVGINTSSIANARNQNTNFAVSIVHVCRVIDLLAAGKDPSPPELTFEFYDMPEKADPLIVAQIDLGSDLSNLRLGDEIIAVGESPIANEGQFIHALRGNLNDADIAVRRDGERIVIEGRFLPAPKITDRQGVMFAGMLFAPRNLRNGALNHGLPHDIMVHSVARGSEGDLSDAEEYDRLASIDGVAITNLTQLHEILASLSDADSVQLDLLRGDSDHIRGIFFRPVRRNVAPTMPEKVGAWDSTQLTRAD